MKIEITTDRGPWIDGKPAPQGWVGEVDQATADILIKRGWAVAQKPKRKAREYDA